MSADNWTVCPNCQEKRNKEIEARTKKINAAYGTVSREKYAELNEELKTFEQTKIGQNLREDYEQGILNGEYYLSYSAVCTICKWSFKKEISEKIKTN